jgi:hypothetical protein
MRAGGARPPPPRNEAPASQREGLNTHEGRPASKDAYFQNLRDLKFTL